MNKITLVINTLNEEKYIANCINSAKSIVDEIIICDMHSDDRTVKIAESLGAKVVFHERTGYVEPARYFAISQASCEWVLVLDADEQMTEKLANELKKISMSDTYDVVLFLKLYNYFGRYLRYGGFFNYKFPLFFKKNKYIEVYTNDEEMIHRNFGNLKNVKNKICLSKEYYIIHDAYPTIEKYLRKTLVDYSIIDSRGRYNNGEKVSFNKLLFSPFMEFIVRYILLQGFRDGKIGFITCYLKSQYTFYILLNIWFLNRNKIS
jgi:glycosyltransferase involved in cell wall biosynthesis